MFIEYLKHHKIDTIVDVRSIPYSRFANQFNKENLSSILKLEGIFYVPMGDNLGARYSDKELLFEDGKVDFSKVVVTAKFKDGICRVETGVKKGHRIALMCSEKNPIECHRFSLISDYLYKKGYDIRHLVENNVFEHRLLHDNLLKYFKEYHKITTDLKKIVNCRFVQGSLFEIESIDEKTLYLKLNQLIGYEPIEAKKEMI
jgi:uncharacterized protein (DUF488 family)